MKRGANVAQRMHDAYIGRLARDTLGGLAPRPVGPRHAYIRVPLPIRLNDLVAAGVETSDQVRSNLLELLSGRMQQRLDAPGRHLERSAAARAYVNRFAAPTR